MMKKRRLGFEPLENRKLLAGNVLATVINGELKVTGDNTSNSIALTSLLAADGTQRAIRIIGRTADGAATLINGKSLPVDLVVPGAKVTIDARGGNDLISLNGLKTSGLTINTGGGKDSVRVTNGEDFSLNPVIIRTAGANSSIADLELEDESVVISNFKARRSLTISTGGGNDRVTISKFAVTNGTTSINTGAGRDIVRISDSDFDRFTLETGASTPSQSNLADDRDEVYLTAVRGNSATLAFGGGNDLLVLARNSEGLGIEVAGQVSVNGGVGSDEIRGQANVTFVGSFVKISVELTV